MIRAKRYIVVDCLFEWLTRFLIKRNFSSIQIKGDFTDNNHSVLVVANHCSWWDGFWVRYLNQKTIHRKFHFMMLEEQIKKYWYFKYIGGYSVKKRSREVVESIDYTLKLLNNNKNLVLMFPQGKIFSSHINSVRFERGIHNIIKKCADNVQVLLVVNLTDYFSNAKPYLFIYTKPYLAATLRNTGIENEYNQFLSEVLKHHKTLTS